jgi:hypothetical protein
MVEVRQPQTQHSAQCQKLPAWRSGDLTKTDTRLAMPYTRGTDDQTRVLPAGALDRGELDP